MANPQDVMLFGAEDLRRIEKVNTEIKRNTAAARARRGAADTPLLDAGDDADGDGEVWTMSYGGSRVGSFLA